MESSPTEAEGPTPRGVLRKTGVYGTPVSCVSFPHPDVLLYSLGAFLERTSTYRASGDGLTATPTPISSRHLVFPNGNTIHGIRYPHSDPNRLPTKSPPPANDGFDATVEVTVRGPEKAKKYALVFGSRHVALVQNVWGSPDHPVMETLSIRVGNVGSAHAIPPSTVWTLSDWIWDCRLQSTSDPRTDTVVVGLAHNNVEVWTLRRSPEGDTSVGGILSRTAQLRGVTRCITYCMDLGRDGYVATGTVRNEIVVWNQPTIHAQNTATDKFGADGHVSGEIVVVPEQARLRGHQGVIHGVKFNSDCRYLASTSDDRSVRLWKRPAGPEHAESGSLNGTNSWSLVWTGWGHTARTWKVAFVEAHNLVISTAEDGTARVWNLWSGDCRAVLRGHGASQNVWGIDVCGDWAVTGGNDGRVATYHIPSSLVAMWKHNEKGTEECVQSWQGTFPIPDDRILSTTGKTSLAQEKGAQIVKKKKKKIVHQILVGMGLVESSSTDVESPRIVVSTRAGSLLSLNLSTGSWITQEPWWNSSLLECNNIDATDACCMAIHPSTGLIAIGTHRGDVVVLLDWDVDQRRRIVWAGNELKSVQKLEWKTSNTLVAFHVDALRWWQIPDSCDTEQFMDESLMTCKVLVPGTKALVLCCALNQKGKLAVVGDTRGNIALFDLNGSVGVDGSMAPRCVLPRAHRKEHVNVLLWISETKVLSGGNDGCLHECEVLDLCRLRSLYSFAVAAYTGIDRIWTMSRVCGSSRFAIAGYRGNEYVAIDTKGGYELFRADTGGRQRAALFSLGVPDRDGSRCANPILTVATSRKDGCNDVTINMRNGRWRGGSYGVGLHNETIFDAAFFPIGTTTSVFGLLTGSEDCTARISLWERGSLVSSIKLPCQESGVRAVCSSTFDVRHGTFLAVAGSQMALQFYHVRNEASEPPKPQNLTITSLGRGWQREKASMDHRINTVTSVPLHAAGDERRHLVLTGDSNGDCVLYHVGEALQTIHTGVLFFREARPVLSSKMCVLGSHVLVLVGTTEGTISFHSVLYGTNIDWSTVQRQNPDEVVQCHTMGTNTIDVCIMESAESEHTILVCSGGDDQSVACFKLHAKLCGSDLNLSIQKMQIVREASRSAVKGIAWLDQSHFASTGYDQKICVWKYTLGSIAKKCSLHVDIGDVNCLAHFQLQSTECTLGIAGAGIELITFNLCAL